MKIRAVIICSTFLLQSASSVFSWEFSLDAGLGASYTDNSLKVSDDEESDYISRLDSQLGVNHEGQAWLVDIDYSAIYEDYDRNTQSDSTQLNGNASVQYEQFEQVLFWNASNSVRSVINDQSLQDTTENRQNRSISTFSPELHISLSRVDSLNTVLAYSRISYEDSNQQDSDRAGGRVGWAHRFSKVDTVELSWEYYDVGFDDSVSDYDYYSTRISYSSELSRLRYTLTAGYNQTDRKIFDDSDGPYLNANFVYDSGVSQWELNALREITDSSRGDNNESLSDLGDSTSASGQVDVYEVISGELAYTNSSLCKVCSVRLSILAAEEDYEILRDDNVELAARVQFGYDLSRRSSLGAGVSYTDYSFTNNNPRADYGLQSYGAFYQYLFTRSFSIRLFADYEKRDSDVSAENYDEASGGIRVSYEFL